MRDKNLNFIQFQEQLDSFIFKKLTLSESLRTAVVITPTLLNEETMIVYPRDFKGLRGLSLIVYYLPENLRWRIWLDLEQMSYSQLNSKQRIEIQILLAKREMAQMYLFQSQRFSSHEIFGNIVYDGNKALRELKVFRESTKVVLPIRRRGYNDKGSLRSPDRWLPDFDTTLTELQLRKEKRTHLHNKSINRIKQKLETLLREVKVD